jgi:hypothetical protein
MAKVVGADHEFHDAAYASGWAARFQPTPDRLRLFDLILAELQARVAPDGLVMELGMGPGYLAEYLLAAMPRLRYCGVDFSRAMLDIAAQRLRDHASRIDYRQADLVSTSWWAEQRLSPGGIVSTWALHDLGSPAHVQTVYIGCAQALDGQGVLLNGDFIKPAGAAQDYEAGRFEIDTHLTMLGRAGFARVDCLEVFEEEVDSPTAAQNYACFRAL